MLSMSPSVRHAPCPAGWLDVVGIIESCAIGDVRHITAQHLHGNVLRFTPCSSAWTEFRFQVPIIIQGMVERRKLLRLEHHVAWLPSVIVSPARHNERDAILVINRLIAGSAFKVNCKCDTHGGGHHNRPNSALKRNALRPLASANRIASFLINLSKFSYW